MGLKFLHKSVRHDSFSLNNTITTNYLCLQRSKNTLSRILTIFLVL